MPTLAEKKRAVVKALQGVTESAALDAELIIAKVTKKTKTQMIMRSSSLLTDAENAAIDTLLSKRKNGEPIAYLLGTKAFWTMDLAVTKDTLIPRPDTECLVQYILDHFDKKAPIKIADLGTGSGAIAIALATERPNWVIHATDKSNAALEIAKQNAEKYNVSHVHFYQGNWCNALPSQNYDLIVSNPPYIAENDPHLPALSHEPLTALVSGKTGLSDIQHIAKESVEYLNKTGTLILEHGFDQQEKIIALLQHASFSSTGFKDLSGQPRFIVAKKD